jgi:hypothetical protein
MQNDGRTSSGPAQTAFPPVTGAEVDTTWRRVVRRRSFLQAGLGVGLASAAVVPVTVSVLSESVLQSREAI